MVFEKKTIEEKMVVFCSTLKPEAYMRLKKASETRDQPMSIILSDLILKHLPKMDMWAAVMGIISDDRNKKKIRKAA